MLRAEGWLVAVVEKWNVHAKVRQNLFGFADLLAIKDGTTLAVQTTSGSNMSHRIHKITANVAATLWLRSPYRQIVVHGWRKCGARGKRKIWQCKVVSVHSIDGSARPIRWEGEVPVVPGRETSLAFLNINPTPTSDS